MKSKILLTTFIIAVIATISSCSSSYKTLQTPDDIYYSPARIQNDYVRTKTDDNVYNSSNVYVPSEDREIRRRVHNRKWRRYDDTYDYPYGYNNYYPPVYVDPKTGATQNKSTPRKFNLGAYNPNAVTSNPQIDPKTGKPVNTSTTNSGSGLGNFIRKVFNNSGSSYDNSNSSNNSPTRTFDQRNNNSNNPGNSNSSGSSNNSSSNKTNSGTNTPVRTFKNDN